MTKIKKEGGRDAPVPAEAKPAEKPKAYTIKYKRPRGSRACKVCRARKVRCDAEIHIPCTNCITFGCECLLPETRKRGSAADTPRKRNPSTSGPKQQPEELPAAMAASTNTEAVNMAAATENDGLAAGDAPANAGAPAMLKPIHNISQISVPPLLTSTYKNRPLMHKRELLASNTRALLTFVGHLSISLMAQKIGQNHVELTEDLFEMSDNLSLDLVELEILKLRGAFLLPGSELAHDLIELYFEHVHPLMPVINRTEFMRKFNDPNDSPSLMLLQAVLLCGLRVLNNPLLFDNRGLSDLASLTFFRRAKALYETNYESDPVSIVQTVLLIGLYWEGPEDVTRNSFYWTRVGVGLAQGFGFHRDISSSPSLTSSEKKIWRRIWWCLFEKDRNVAIAFGRPATIDLTDCDVPMLTMDDFDESDPEQGVVLPYPLNETQALYFIHLVKLAEITGIIIKHQYTVKAEQMKRVNKFSVIQRCDMLMGIWFTNLPSQLQFSLTDALKQNFYACLLNAQYYNRLYLVHRANLLRMARSSSTNPNNYKYPSWGISFQSARMISIVSKIILDKGSLKYCPVMFVYILFSALIMLTYHVDSLNQVIASTASDSLFISRAVLKELGKYWPIVSVLIKLFDKYANDKIKRAQMIERGTIIAEMQERKNGQHSQTGMSSKAVPSASSPTLVTSGISPRGNSYTDFRQQSNFPGSKQSNRSQPDIELLVRQYKQNGELQKDKNFDEDGHAEGVHKSGRQSNNDTTPSSQHSFPDISLVTEKMPTSQNFFENFEPTQLFPNVLASLPPTRSHSPVLDQEQGLQRPKDDMADTPTPFQGSIYGSSTNLNNNGDLFTNFMDSSFINMNLQSNLEEENLLTDDLGSLFNLQNPT